MNVTHRHRRRLVHRVVVRLKPAGGDELVDCDQGDGHHHDGMGNPYPMGHLRHPRDFADGAGVKPGRACFDPTADQRFDLHEEDGHLGLDSEIWMGALYVNSRVSPPPMEGRIPFDSWFSERPIPEIEGEPSTDPVLLGEPEHLGRHSR